MVTESEILMEKMKSRNILIAVLGMGNVSLPLGVVFAEADFNLTGVDLEKRLANAVVK